MTIERRLVMVVLSATVLASCGSSSSSDAGAGGYGTGKSAVTTSATTAPVTTFAGSATVVLAENATAGHAILVDAVGRSLYLFERDSGTTSACTSSGCASSWPGFAPTGDLSAGPGVASDKLGRVDGQVAQQVTYGGHLLYYFAGDSKPGDLNGAGIPGWYAVGADGAKVAVGGSGY